MTENIDFPPPARIAHNSDVRFSNRPLGSSAFPTVHRCNVDVARGLVAAGGEFVAATKSRYRADDDGGPLTMANEIEPITRRVLQHAKHRVLQHAEQLSNLYLDDANNAADENSMELSRNLPHDPLMRLALPFCLMIEPGCEHRHTTSRVHAVVRWPGTSTVRTHQRPAAPA